MSKQAVTTSMVSNVPTLEAVVLSWFHSGFQRYKMDIFDSQIIDVYETRSYFNKMLSEEIRLIQLKANCVTILGYATVNGLPDPFPIITFTMMAEDVLLLQCLMVKGHYKQLQLEVAFPVSTIDPSKHCELVNIWLNIRRYDATMRKQRNGQPL